MTKKGFSTAKYVFSSQRVVDTTIATMSNLFITLLPKIIIISKEDPNLSDGCDLISRALKRSNDKEDFIQASLQTLLQRTVDNLNSYLGDILYVLLKNRPEILKTSQKMEIESILNCGDLDEIIQMIAYKKVDELTYGGYLSISNYFETRLGITIPSTEHFVKMVREAIAVRNIIVHNRCKVNQRFINETKRVDVCIHDKYLLSHKAVLVEYIPAIENFVDFVDTQLISKYGNKIFI